MINQISSRFLVSSFFIWWKSRKSCGNLVEISSKSGRNLDSRTIDLKFVVVHFELAYTSSKYWNFFSKNIFGNLSVVLDSSIIWSFLILVLNISQTKVTDLFS